MLHIHRSERADGLVPALAEVLAEPAADPFVADVVAVPAKGVERWLAQRLSRRLGVSAGDPLNGDGICANVRFPAPSAMLDSALASVSGIDPDTDPWAPDVLVWHVLACIDEAVQHPWAAALAGHLGATTGPPPGDDAGDGGRRLRTAQRLADLFLRYGEWRPRMIVDWAGGDPTDGRDLDLPKDLRWQPRLWAMVRARVAVPAPAERIGAGCAALRDDPTPAGLPARLSVFGPSRLTAAQGEVLRALSARLDVHLWLPHPSDALWRRELTRRQGRPDADAPRPDPVIDDLSRHPLLRSLGRDTQETEALLAAAGTRGPVTGVATPVTDHHHETAAPPGTLLGLLQQGIRDDQPPGPAASLPVLAADDRSVQVHACHGPARQVEVLRDLVVGILADRPDLQPRDILVMCPDVEEYAPLVSATFGLDDGSPDQHPGHRLRVTLADRSLRVTNPVLDVLGRVLDLADGRATARQVLDLASTEPVRARFRFDDDDLERLRAWAGDAGVRWGLHARHRERFGLPRGLMEGTWHAGLNRLALGVALPDDGRFVRDTVPLDVADSTDIALVGRLTEFITRLAGVIGTMARPGPITAWGEALNTVIDHLTAVPAATAWQQSEARAEIGWLVDTAGGVADRPLGLDDMRAALRDRLGGRPTRAGFRTGGLTVCSLVPMRSVPHKVICLLGLDDGVFPRARSTDGDDVLARTKQRGARDQPSEDRQMLLDALMAAEDQLVILYTGADPRTNAPRPPCAPVAELIDAVSSTARAADGSALVDHVVIRHPVQPFDARCFTPGALGTPRPFSHDRPALRAAHVALGERHAAPPFLARPLPAPPVDHDIPLDGLISAVVDPAAALLRQRLAAPALAVEEDDLPEDLAISLKGLPEWGLGDRMLRSMQTGLDVAQTMATERRRGVLPPRQLSNAAVDDVGRQVQDLWDAAFAGRPDGSADVVDLLAELPGDRAVVGSAAVRGDTLVRVEYATLKPKHRLQSWIRLLALTVGRPDRTWSALTVGRAAKDRGSKRSAGVQQSMVGPVPPDVAAQALGRLVAVRDLALRGALPFALTSSHDYVRSRRQPGATIGAALTAAASAWENGRYPERSAAAARLVWGAEAPLEVLLDAGPAVVVPPDWPQDSTWFGVLAQAVWGPLLDAETLS